MSITVFINYVTESKQRIILFLFLLSIAVRFLCLTPFFLYDIPLVTDENEYLDRAVGFTNALIDMSHSERPSSDALYRAYGNGMWPPLQPFFLGMVFFIFGKHLIAGRIILCIVSAVTTLLIYLLTLRLSNSKAAFTAAIMHLLYPSFIGYSNYLFSETLYIFLLISSVYFAVRVCDGLAGEKTMAYALASGLFLGLCGLTRPAVLPFLILIPLWLAFFIKNFRRRLLLPALLILAYLAVLVPWQGFLVIKEKDPGILSNIPGWYLSIGNNQWIPEGYGSSWQDDSRGQMLNSAREYGKLNSISTDQALRRLAIDEIKNNFTAFLVRGIYKFRMFWSMDFFVLIHVFYAGYPPMSPAIAAVIWGVVLVSYLSVLLLSVYGFLVNGSSFRNKSLILLLVAGGMAPSFVTFGISRFHLPLLALLLPVAGFGAINLKQKLSLHKMMTMVLISALILFSVLSSLPLVVSKYLMPSSHYCGLIGAADKILNSKTDCIDKVILRVDPSSTFKSIRIRTETNGFSLNMTQKDMWIRPPKTMEFIWELSAESKILRLDVYARNTSLPMELSIRVEGLNEMVTVKPINMISWRKWQSSGIRGIEYMWLGGGMGVRNKLPDDELFSFL